MLRSLLLQVKLTNSHLNQKESMFPFLSYLCWQWKCAESAFFARNSTNTSTWARVWARVIGSQLPVSECQNWVTTKLWKNTLHTSSSEMLLILFQLMQERRSSMHLSPSCQAKPASLQTALNCAMLFFSVTLHVCQCIHRHTYVYNVTLPPIHIPKTQEHLQLLAWDDFI